MAVIHSRVMLSLKCVMHELFLKMVRWLMISLVVISFIVCKWSCDEHAVYFRL